MIFMQVLKKIMSSNSVSHKKGEIPEDGLSRIQQQMEFMFGELMTRIEKLETRYDGGRSKRGREARKEESVAGNSTDEANDDLNHGGGFCTHRGERYKNRSRSGHIRPHRDFEHTGDFDDLGDIYRNLGSIKL
jgi:hypothetical protein